MASETTGNFINLNGFTQSVQQLPKLNVGKLFPPVTSRSHRDVPIHRLRQGANSRDVLKSLE